ncbi:hypothetical protein D9613_004436 [Agrocybe pediades]|uniref:Nephrocystin 3-like N-terminal domain-containing protein n=1 Tax=Agrocybe pediades TaxID=84607 RepID=A0A8H4QIL9_9AGAR|nr:hypothetical protein D9613_004436 [Agrocybe pediades]
MSQPGSQIPPLINLSNSIIAGGTFNQHIDQRQYLHSGERAGYARLVENVATAALHDSVHVVDPPKCHPNTRVTIIQTIIDWASSATLDEEVNQKPILWLKGGAGAGKSAIARSVAERCSKEGSLLGAFFFGAADPTRNHVGRLVATLAYQVCLIVPEFRDIVSTVIEDDPLVFSRSVGTQFTALFIRPLSTIVANQPGTVKVPRLVVIDGLDECRGGSQRDLLFALQETTSSTTFIRVLVSSRPESHLNNAFSSSRLVHIHYKIFLDDDYSAQEDIRLYLDDKFGEIKEGHVFKHKLPATWPGPDIIRELVYRSSGHFIYASTVVRYVESSRHRPDQRLDVILNLRPPFKDLPFTELDALYRHVISKAEAPSTVVDILAFPILYGTGVVDGATIEKMLQLEDGDVEVILADLQSLVKIDCKTMYYGESVEVELLHKSLGDFLCDSQRAGDFYLDPFTVQVHHTTRLISIVSTTFEHWGIRALDDKATWLLAADEIIVPIQIESRGSVHGVSGEKHSYVYSDFLQAALQFPTFNLIKQMHTDLDRHQHEYASLFNFLSAYLRCLHSVVGV